MYRERRVWRGFGVRRNGEGRRERVGGCGETGVVTCEREG